MRDWFPSVLDPGLATNALVHALLPGYIYYYRLYVQAEEKEQPVGKIIVAGKRKGNGDLL